MKYSFLIISFLLAGCVHVFSPQERAMSEAVSMCSYLPAFSHPGTPKQIQDFYNCRNQQYAQLMPVYMQQDQNNRMLFQQNMAQANHEYTEQMQMNNQMMMNAFQPRRSTNTNCYTIGNNLNCTTN